MPRACRERAWRRRPAGTQSFVVNMLDPDVAISRGTAAALDRLEHSGRSDGNARSDEARSRAAGWHAPNQRVGTAGIRRPLPSTAIAPRTTATSPSWLLRDHQQRHPTILRFAVVGGVRCDRILRSESLGRHARRDETVVLDGRAGALARSRDKRHVSRRRCPYCRCSRRSSRPRAGMP